MHPIQRPPVLEPECQVHNAGAMGRQTAQQTPAVVSQMPMEGMWVDLGEHGPTVSVTVRRGQRAQAKVSAEQPDQDASCQRLHPQGQRGKALLQTSRVTTVRLPG